MAVPSLNLRDLNEAQRSAVLTEGGPLLVLAGAGTGKTRVVTTRIAWLVGRGVPASRILAVTFTNKAAQEMQARVGELLGRRLTEKPHVSTFHSFCVGVLRRHITRLGYPARFRIFAANAQRSLAQRVLREAKLPGTALRPDDLMGWISRWKSQGVTASHAAQRAENDRQHLAAIAYRRYQQSLKLQGAVDFDDLLCLTQTLFQKDAAVRAAEAARFDHVLIDEYQDTNASQYRIVRWLAAGHRNLCVVGDDDQSIYSWRGAEVTHILSFRKDWPEASVIRLEQNYRSTAGILACANQLILQNRHRHPKQLRSHLGEGLRPQVRVYDDGDEEASQVVADIARRLSAGSSRPADVAILFRTNEQPRPFEQALRRRGVPYVLIGGHSFFDRREVQDILSYWRLLCEPSDDLALVRICNRPARGISSATVQAWRARAAAAGRSMWEIAADAPPVPSLPGAANAAVVRFHQQMSGFAERMTREPPGDVARALVQAIDYRSEIETVSQDHDERGRRWQCVEDLLADLEKYAATHRQWNLSDYLDDLVLRDRDFGTDKEQQLASDRVRLMTLHAAKGLEFPVVYLVGLEEGLLPHRKSLGNGTMAIEEERRLCYVGVTRAREELLLSVARQREKRGSLRPSHPSRFLYELLGRTDHPDYHKAMHFIDETARRSQGPNTRRSTGTRVRKPSRRRP